MIIEKLPAVQRLSESEKLALAAELVEQATLGESGEPDPRIVEILDERLAEFRRHPENASSWAEVKARILASNA